MTDNFILTDLKTPKKLSSSSKTINYHNPIKNSQKTFVTADKIEVWV